jgi:hypothetical protein
VLSPQADTSAPALQHSCAATLHTKAMFCLQAGRSWGPSSFCGAKRKKCSTGHKVSRTREAPQERVLVERGWGRNSGYEICKKALAALRRSTYQRRGLLHASFRVRCHSSGSLWGMLRGSGTWAFKKGWYKKRNEPRRGLRLR